jgi:hypothetical protein
MIKRPDVDIDFADREQLLKLIPHVPARQISPDHQHQRHKTGVYFHPVPVDPYTGWCDLDYQQAEQAGFFKVDLLNVGLYQQVKNKQHLEELAAREPLWDLLEQPDFTSLLFHVSNHSDILRTMKPTCIEQLAAVLAMIRPAKRYLVGQSWDRVMREVWTKPAGDEYYFKKSHGTAYAVAIVAQMNLICEQISYGYS